MQSQSIKRDVYPMWPSLINDYWYELCMAKLNYYTPHKDLLECNVFDLSVSQSVLQPFYFVVHFLSTAQQNFKKLFRVKGVILRVCTYLWETLVPLFCWEFSILKCFAIHEYTTETIKFHHNSSFDWIILSKNNAPFISYFLYGNRYFATQYVYK